MKKGRTYGEKSIHLHGNAQNFYIKGASLVEQKRWGAISLDDRDIEF